jgi:Protein of unknown function (DUF1580)
MIDPLTDTTLSLAQAARRLPRLRAGRPVHPATLWRWSTKGVRGVKLETAMVGGVRVTSEAALSRFIAALSSLPAPTAMGDRRAALPLPAGGRSPVRSRREEHIDRQLDAEGI